MTTTTGPFDPQKPDEPGLIEETQEEAQQPPRDTHPPKLTKGEYRVGITFNPSKFPEVDKLKRMAADLIDEIEKVALASDNGDVKRCSAIAQTEVESACHWAVKAATKPAQ